MLQNTPTCRTISVSFGPVLLTIVQLLPQIIVRKNMRTALFSVVCALPVFIMDGAFWDTVPRHTKKLQYLKITVTLNFKIST